MRKVTESRRLAALFLRKASVQLYGALFALTTIFLVIRVIPISLDDLQYVDSFLYSKISEFEFSPLTLLIEEPLWSAYCEFMSFMVSPEMSIRITILVSVVILALIPLILGARGLLFYWVWFAFHPHLAPEIAFNQIRQGFALAIFMGLFALSKRVVLPVIVGTLVHTSIASLGILAISKRYLLAMAVPVALALLLTLFSSELSGLLGRRAFYLEEPIELTINYYVVNATIIVFFGVLLFGYQRREDNASPYVAFYWGWFYFSISVLVISVFLQFGPRLEYFSAYLLGLLLSMSDERKDNKILYARVFALLYLVLLDGRLEYTDEPNSPLHNWALILGLR